MVPLTELPLEGAVTETVGGVVSEPDPAAWFTVKVRPAIVIVPERELVRLLAPQRDRAVACAGVRNLWLSASAAGSHHTPGSRGYSHLPLLAVAATEALVGEME
jgi:hypothetical protein